MFFKVSFFCWGTVPNPHGKCCCCFLLIRCFIYFKNMMLTLESQVQPAWLSWSVMVVFRGVWSLEGSKTGQPPQAVFFLKESLNRTALCGGFYLWLNFSTSPDMAWSTLHFEIIFLNLKSRKDLQIPVSVAVMVELYRWSNRQCVTLNKPSYFWSWLIAFPIWNTNPVLIERKQVEKNIESNIWW